MTGFSQNSFPAHGGTMSAAVTADSAVRVRACTEVHSRAVITRPALFVVCLPYVGAEYLVLDFPGRDAVLDQPPPGLDQGARSNNARPSAYLRPVALATWPLPARRPVVPWSFATTARKWRA